MCIADPRDVLNALSLSFPTTHHYELIFEYHINSGRKPTMFTQD